MPTLEARGIEIVWSERGEGPAILLVHETAANGGVWDAVGEALAPRARAISYDRRGWGASTAPEGYRRTIVEEQSEDAVALLESAKAAPAVVVGAGIGAIVALDLLLRRPDLVAGTPGDRGRSWRERHRPLPVGRPAGARSGSGPAPG